MNIVEKKLSEIQPYENNPRNNDEAVKYVAESIKKYGFKVPIVIDADGVIVTGHTRYKASKQLGLESVPCVIADDLTEEQIKAYRLVDNKVSEKATWDIDLLDVELNGLDFGGFDFGFDMSLDLSMFDDFEPLEEKPKKKEDKGYRIVYEIAFNDEDEQARWQRFLVELKRKYPDVDTIAERILLVTDKWVSDNGI